MPIPSDQFSVLDEGLNRLATEIVLAQVGRDDGLVPAYSLLGELREICSMEPILREAIGTQQARLEQHLDSAQPFDAVTLGGLRQLVEWLPRGIEAVKLGQLIPRLATENVAAVVPAAPAAPDRRPGVAEASDVLLQLHLDENRELLVEFHVETLDHLQLIEAALLTLDQHVDDPEALNSIFRSFHTIKGNAGFLGLIPMQMLAHEVESLLDLARNQKLRLHPAIITEILGSRDALAAFAQQVGHALETGELPGKVIPVSHLVKAVKALASGSEATPPASSARETTAALASVLTGPAALEEVPMEATSDDRRVADRRVCRGLRGDRSMEATSDDSRVADAAPEAGKTSSALPTVRVSTEKLDSLMNVAGELVIIQSQLFEAVGGRGSAHTGLQHNVAQLGRIAKELQRTTMALRMIPIKGAFQKMERLARDLARDFGKKVAFVTTGEETELDRTVVEKIGDPLVHMVRNALDHGLEAPADRVAAGKSEIGRLQLRAYHQSSNLVIELEDDGRGLDPDRLLAKAQRQQLVPDPAQLTREEIFNLIFLPGFSTAEKVTAVSGRGVGMDVVKRNIEKLRGRIEIKSELGRGSTFKINLPLTMAIIDGLVVRVGADRFILPSTSVLRALRPAREQIATIFGRGEVVDLHGRQVPLHRLHRRFGIADHAEQPWDGIVVVIEHAGRTSCLLVDELVSRQEVVIKSLGAYLQNVPGVAGGAILGDGSIALILDPGALLQAA